MVIFTQGSSMLRRVSPFIAALTVWGAMACTTRSESDTDKTPASEEAANLQEGAAKEDDNTSERTTPRSLEAREVKEVEGVLTKTTLDEGAALHATWGDCALEGTLAQAEGQTRSPLRRVLKHDDHLYVLSEYDGNESKLRAFVIEHEKDRCAIKPWTEFASNGELDLGVGVVDLSIVGDHLIATGIDTTLYTLEGEQSGTCDDFQRMTRLRGRSGHPEAVFRKGGEEIIHATVQNGTCTQTHAYTLEGEEALGMRLVPTDAQSLFATLQVDRVPNALAYIHEGKIVWRYFPGNQEPQERIALITELASLNQDLVAVRGLQKTLDIITAQGERRAKIDMNANKDLDRMAFPDKVVALDDQTLLVVLRHHVSADEIEKLSLQTLTLSPDAN